MSLCMIFYHFWSLKSPILLNLNKFTKFLYFTRIQSRWDKEFSMDWIFFFKFKNFVAVNFSLRSIAHIKIFLLFPLHAYFKFFYNAISKLSCWFFFVHNYLFFLITWHSICFQVKYILFNFYLSSFMNLSNI